MTSLPGYSTRLGAPNENKRRVSIDNYRNTPSIRFYQKLGAKLRRQWILTRLTGAPLSRLARRAARR
jgi:hypothetical protein